MVQSKHVIHAFFFSCWISPVLSEVDHKIAALHAERLWREQGSLHEWGDLKFDAFWCNHASTRLLDMLHLQ